MLVWRSGAWAGSRAGAPGCLPPLPIPQLRLTLLPITWACPDDEVDPPESSQHRVGAESRRGGFVLIWETGGAPRARGADGGARAEVSGPQLGAVHTACPGVPTRRAPAPPHPQYRRCPSPWTAALPAAPRPPGLAGAFHQTVREGTTARNVPFARAHWRPGGQQPCGVGDVSPEVQAWLVLPRGLASQEEDDLTPRAARLASPEQSLPGATGGTSAGRGTQGAQVQELGREVTSASFSAAAVSSSAHVGLCV